MKFAIIEDNPLYATLLRQYLRGTFRDSDIEQFTSGENFIHKAKDHAAYDVIFLDLNLDDKRNTPLISGFDIIEYCRENGVKTRFLLLSSTVRTDDLERANNLNVSFLLKEDFGRIDSPYDITSIVKAI